MYLLDTNHCSRLIFGETNLIQQNLNIFIGFYNSLYLDIKAQEVI
jgi:predicted nucleic acid-binding protein